MSAVVPVKISTTTVIVSVNELVNHHLLHLILKLQVIMAHYNLIQITIQICFDSYTSSSIDCKIRIFNWHTHPRSPGESTGAILHAMGGLYEILFDAASRFLQFLHQKFHRWICNMYKYIWVWSSQAATIKVVENYFWNFSGYISRILESSFRPVRRRKTPCRLPWIPPPYIKKKTDSCFMNLDLDFGLKR